MKPSGKVLDAATEEAAGAGTTLKDRANARAQHWVRLRRLLGDLFTDFLWQTPKLSKLSPQFQRAKGNTPLKREETSMLSPEHQS